MKTRYINPTSSFKKMTYLKEKGYEARAFYLNVVYLVMLFLGVLAAGSLNAEVKYTVAGKEVTAPRYRRCFLNGTQAEYDTAALPDSMYGKGCIPIAGTEDADGKFTPTDDDKHKQELMDQIFNISLAVAIINGLFFAHSVIMHFSTKLGIGIHFKYQWVFSIINLGLFSGVVGWLNSVKDIQEAVNVDNNIYFVDTNLFLVAVFGVILATLDTIGSNLIVYVLCTSERGYMCNPST